MDESDSALLARAAAGEAAAMHALLERHGQPIWGEINRDIGTRWQSAIDADDVMQVTYVEAFLQMGRLGARDTASFVSWLRRIAHNNLRDAIKELDRKRRPRRAQQVHALGTESPFVGLVEMLGATSATPSRQIAADEASRIIHATLERLPPDYGRVIQLYDLECRDIAEVAGALGRSPGAVHMLRARAHDRLRTLLGSESRFFTHAT